MGNYILIKKQAEALIDSNASAIGNIANICSLLFNNIENLNWVGVYIKNGESLYLGPFMGKPACTIIPVSKGMCGKAVRENHTLVINDVLAEPDHIACDSSSRSEVVSILHRENKIWGVLDIDAPIQNRFEDSELVDLIEFVAKLISEEILDKYTILC